VELSLYPVDFPSELEKIKQLKEKLTDVVVTKVGVPWQRHQFVSTLFYPPIELI
jgi:hypothetical protein